MPVPNSFPSLPAAYRIAFCGEAPGRDEVSQGRPFVGASGRFFNQLLSKANLLREACFIGNVCQEQPEDNVIARFDYDGDEIQRGLDQLTQDLQKYKPHLIVPLGNLALHAVKNAGHVLKKRRDKDGYKFVYPQSIDNWRGSKFLSSADSVLPGTKCLGSFHPAYCLRQYENTPYLMMDLLRVAKEGLTPTLTTPNRVLDTDAPFATIMERLAYLRNVSPLSMDIEGYVWGMSCISNATNESASFCIPFFRKDGSSCWSEDEEMQILRGLSALLADPNVKKIWQNGLYDRFVLQYGFHMPVLGNIDDTMLKFWEKYCELEKNLGVQASILTDEPFYKGDRKTQDDHTFYEYCCKDSAVTYEINERLTPLLAAHAPRALDHYRFNHSLLNLFLYCELRGIRYDIQKAQERLSTVNTYFYRLQAELDAIAQCGIPHNCIGKDLEAVIRHVACHKRDKTKPLKEYESTLAVMLALCLRPALTKEEYGFLDIQLGFDLNIKSPNLKHYLYTEQKIPAKYNKNTGNETSDGLAILKLSKQHPHPALEKVAEIAFLRTRTTFLNISADPDERIRCGYNAVGTETGRITCYTSPTGSGYNLTTMPDEDPSFPPSHPLHNGMRDLVIADPGHYLFQCDLKGADGWTVGAHLARLGDSTMLDDLKCGIKPAQRICYLLRHGVHALNGKQRPEILELLKEVKKSDWDYFACKVGIWGVCYLMGPDLLADQIFEESSGKVAMTREEVKRFHHTVMDGYKLKLWHNAMEKALAFSPTLTSASGNKRRFYGRPGDVLGKALSQEPQNNTSYAVNLAALRLWNDPENRVSDHLVGEVKVPFIVEPLHNVYDALIGQFPIDRAAWAVGKINEWFDNAIEIAGQRITIPFEGAYGPSWGQLDKGKI